MADTTQSSLTRITTFAPPSDLAAYARGWRLGLILLALFLVNVLGQIDRILPFILAESIKRDLALSDTQIGLLTGLAFAVCYTLLSLPLARAADRGSPRFVLVLCVVVWSAMTSLGGLAASFVFLAMTRFGVAFGEAGAMPAGHALIGRLVRPDRRGLAIGLFSMGIPIGTMLGFAVGGAIGDSLGWRVALIGAGALGGLIALFALVAIGPTPSQPHAVVRSEPYLRSSLRLLTSPVFRWIFATAIAVGFAATPFYAFSAPFLIRTHGFTASQVGLAFGLLQGLMGIAGTLAGGRGFDRAIRAGTGRLLGPPAVLFLVSAVTTTAALFAPTGWLSIALMVPAMLSFTFALPYSFGAAHLVAGPGRQAQATSLAMIGSGLLGPALGPVIVGVVSDAVTAAGVANGLGFGLLIVPVAATSAGAACLVANRRLAVFLVGR